MAKRLSLWLPPLVYMAVIFHLSSESNPLPEVTTVVWDKLLHTTEYAGLAALLCRAFLGEGFSLLGAALIAGLLTSLYGASDEVHQRFTPGRDSDVHDWYADSTGAVIGVAACSIAARALGHEATKPTKPRNPGIY